MSGYRRIHVSRKILEGLLLGELRSARSNVPEDIQVINIRWDVLGRYLELVCLSDSWEMAPEGERPPVFEVVYRDPIEPEEDPRGL